MVFQSPIPAPLIYAALAWLVFRIVQCRLLDAQGHARPKSDFRLGPLLPPFIKAVFAGSVAALGMQMAIPEAGLTGFSDMTGSSIISRLAILMMLPALLMVMAPVAFLAGLAVNALRIRRGIADVIAGAIAGSSAWFGDVIMGHGSFGGVLSADLGGGAQMMAASFTLGGAVAGFAFWAARGYPGVRDTTAHTIRRTRDGLDAADALASGSALGVGVAAARSFRKHRSPR